VRAYSTFSPNDNNNYRNGLINPAVVYEDAYSMKKKILNENKGKAGIYKLTNKLTGDIYVGQSRDLGKRFTNYFNLSYINRRKELIVSRALIKYAFDINHIQGASLNSPRLYTTNTKDSLSQVVSDHPINP
jgi:hypothetical protein